jgi:hypothetical protein
LRPRAFAKIERTAQWNAKETKIWTFVIAAIPAATVRVSAANVCNIICKTNSFPVAVSRRKRKNPSIAVLRRLPEHGIYSFGPNQVFFEWNQD